MMAACRSCVALLLLLPLGGCGGHSADHPAIGQLVVKLPLVSLRDPALPAPEFVGRVTLLNFWGTWCPPCRRELPGLARIAGRLADDSRFQLVAVSCGSGRHDDVAELTTTTAAFLESQRIAIDAWADPDGLTRTLFAAAYGFEAYPTTYLVGPDARVRAVWTGYRSRDEADMARWVVAVLKEAPESAPRAAR